MLRLTLRDLQYRALRFLLTVIGTGLIFSLVMVMTGLSGEFRTESRDTIDAFNVDRWVVAEGPESPFTGAKTIPEVLADDLERTGTHEAGPVTVGVSKALYGGDTHTRWLIGSRPGALGSPRISAGKGVAERGEVVANDDAGLTVGQKLRVGTSDLRVVGLSHGWTVFGGVDMLFLHITDAQKIFYAGRPLASAVLVNGKIGETPRGYKVMTAADVSDDIFGSVQETSNALDIVATLLWIAATCLMAAVVYLSAIERLRDFAVIKAHGGSTLALLGSLVLEAVVVALVAAAAGIVLQRLIEPVFPFPIDPPRGAYVRLVVIAVTAGVVASLGAVRRAARVDPVVAFSAAGG